MKKIFTSIFAIMFLSSVMHAQITSCTVESTSSCPGSISVPVVIQNGANIGAISLKLDFDNTVLTYTGYQNEHAYLTAGMFVANESNGSFYLSYLTTTGISLSNDTIIELQFYTNGGDSDLEWDATNGSCELVTPGGITIITSFNDGAVSPAGTIAQINTQASNQTVLEGEACSFSLAATGVASYQWQRSSNNGSTWNNLINTSIYSGAQTSELNLISTSLSMNGYQYRCIVDGTCPSADTSDVAILTVNVQPQQITISAASVTSCGGNISIPVSISEASNLAAISLSLNYDENALTFIDSQNLNDSLTTYGFHSLNASNGTVLFSWVNTSALNLNASELFTLNFISNNTTTELDWADDVAGSCELTHIDGSVIISYYVNGQFSSTGPIPEITADPLDLQTLVGESASFSIAANGATAYQWQSSSNNGGSWVNLNSAGIYAGTTNNELFISGTALSMNLYQYRCIVTGICSPADTSAIAKLFVSPQPQTIDVSIASVNNSCTGNIHLPINVTNFDNVGAVSLKLNYNTSVLTFKSVSSHNPAIGTMAPLVNESNGGAIISWASANAATIGNGIFMTLVFESAGGTSSLDWDVATPGNCEIAAFDGSSIQTNYSNGSATINSNPLIINAGVNDTIIAGTGIALNPAVSGGSSPYAYLWQPATGLSLANIANPFANPAATTTYELQVTDNNSCTGIDQITITVIDPSLPQINEHPVAALKCENDEHSFAVSATGNGISFQWQLNGTNIPGATDSIYQMNPVLTTSAGTYTCVVSNQFGTLISNPAALTVNAMPQPSFSGLPLTLCTNNASISLTASPAGGTFSGLGIENINEFNPALAGAGNINITYAVSDIVCYAEANASILVSQAPSVTLTINNVDCNGAQNGAIELSNINAANPYTTVWSNGASSASLSGLEPGNYTLTLSDANYCSSIELAEITEPALLELSGVANDISSFGANNGAITTTVAGGTLPYFFAWSNGATTANLSNLSAGTYTLSITDDNGCSAQESFTINEPALLTINSSIQGISCSYLQDGEITLAISGGISPYAYLWSNGASTATVSGLGAATYDVTVTDANSNTATESYLLAAPPALTVSSSTSNPTCYQANDGSISTTVSGGTSPYTYLWSNGANASTLALLPPGEYSLEITDVNGCELNDTVTLVEPPVFMIDGTVQHVTVNGASDGAITLNVIGGTAPYIYFWSNGATGINNTNLTAGSYSVTVEDASGCSTIAEFTVNEPNQLQVTADLTHLVCNSDGSGTIALNISGGIPPYTIDWSNTQTQSIISSLDAGIYLVTITDDAQATVSASYTITEPDALDLTANITHVSSTGQMDGAIDITASGGTIPYSYYWSSININEDLSNLTQGNYSVTVTDQNGCTIADSYTVDLNVDIQLCNDGDNHLLDFGTPTGGIYFGDYVTNNNGSFFFNPTIATIGQNLVYYQFANDTTELTIEVVEAITPGAFTLNLPSDNSYGLAYPINFSWTSANNADSYELYIWDKDDVQPAVATVTSIVQNSYAFSQYLDQNSIYKWQVKAQNMCAENSSNIHQFAFTTFPDLQVSAITTPIAVTTGGNISATFTIENTGLNGTAWSVWNDELYLSQDNVFDNTDISIGSFERSNSLGLNDSYTNAVSAQTPAGLLGNYYLIVVANGNNALSESDYTNNYLVATNPILFTTDVLPDLIVNNINITESSLVPDSMVTVNWVVINTGDSIADGGWSQKVSLINNGQRSVLGFVQNSEQLSIYGSVSQSVQFTIPKYTNITDSAHIEIKLTPNFIEKVNGNLNNIGLSAEKYKIENKLYLSKYEVNLTEGAPNGTTLNIYRSGSRTNSLSVNLTQAITNLQFPSSVIIPAGQSGTSLTIQALDNNIVNTEAFGIVQFTAANYNSKNLLATIIDDETPSLFVWSSADQLEEGDSLYYTVSRGNISNNPLQVNIQTSPGNQLDFPSSATINAGDSSLTLVVNAIDNITPELDDEVGITISAPGYELSTDSIFVFDNDMPILGLEIIQDTISEAAGVNATWGRLFMQNASQSNIKVILSADPASEIYFPAQVIIPAGTTEKMFNIGAIDNLMLDGTRSVELNASIYLSSCNCTAAAQNGGSVTANIVITDNDGPSISASASPYLVNEGITNAGTITLSLNTTFTSDLTVAIVSNDASELTVASSAIIPANQSAVEVPFTTIDDGIEDGDQYVSITAYADTLSPASCWVMVTDQNLPDLVVADFSIATDTITLHDSLSIAFKTINQGHASIGDEVNIQIVLSENAIYDANDPIIFESATESSMNPGDTLAISENVLLNDQIGGHYIFAVVNGKRQSTELVYSNNASAALPLYIRPDYNATAIVDGDIFNGNSPITIYGTVRDLLLQAVPNKAIDVYVVVNNARRVYKTQSDNTGAFSIDFIPINGEAGEFSVGACFPDQGLNEVQDEFTILGMKYKGPQLVFDLNLNEAVNGMLQIKNQSLIPLSNMNIEVVSAPSNCDFSFTSVANLAGNTTTNLAYTVTGTGISTGTNYQEVKLRIFAASGADYHFSAWFYCSTLEGHIAANPSSMVNTMVVDETNLVELEIENIGLGETQFIEIILPQAEWMSLVSLDTINNILPGSSSVLTMRLQPGTDLPLNVPVTGSIAINCANANNLMVPFSFEPISTSTGSLLVDVVDEYTYNTAAAPHLANAHVQLLHPYTGATIADTVTNAQGIVQIDTIPEGYYTLKVDAAQHTSEQYTVYIDKGVTTTETVFIQFQAISYSWEVIPTEVEDSYDVELVVEYETNVPIPVVVMTIVDSIPALEYGETFTFLITMTNEGLITADDVEMTLPENAEYEFSTLVESFDLLPQQTVQVPAFVTRTANKSASNAGLTCHDMITAVYTYHCGSDNRWHEVGSSIVYHESVCEDESNGGGGFYLPMIPQGPSIPRLWLPTISLGSPDIEYEPSSFETNSKNCKPCAQNISNSMDGQTPAHGTVYVFPGQNGWFGGAGAVNNLPPSDYEPAKTNVIGFASSKQGNTSNSTIGFGSIVSGMTSGSSGSIFKNLRKCTKTTIVINGVEYEVPNMSSEANTTQVYKNAPVQTDSSYAHVITNMYYIMKAEIGVAGILRNVYKEEDWYKEGSISLFFNEFRSKVDTTFVIDSVGIASLKNDYTWSVITDSLIDVFAARWNQGINYHQIGINNISQLPAGWNPDFIERDSIVRYGLMVDSSFTYATANGYTGMNDLIDYSYEFVEDYIDKESESVCASITLGFSQTLSLTREAFEGTLTLFNGHDSMAMENVSLDLIIEDEDGIQSNNLFQINTESLNILTEIDGTGTLAAQATGSAVILFIPENGAAPLEAKTYYFGGTLSYLDPFTNTVVTKSLFPATIEVHPSPDLHLDYFIQRDILGDDALTESIEPSIAADFAVLIHNQGAGQARNVMIESAEPQILDNDKGLLIDFNIVGASLGAEEKNLGLKDIHFGNIAAGKTGVGHWWVTSSLLGHFISYGISVNHSDNYGNQDLSLVSSAEVHELTHSISAYGTMDDSIADFLVNEIPDINDNPDQLFFSNGTTADVHIATSGTFDGLVTLQDTVVDLSMLAYQTGWNYIKLDDPGDGMYRIVSVTRNDGQIIPLDNAWLTHVTIPDGGEPIYENKFHFVDDFSQLLPVTYTIVFEPLDHSTPEVVAVNGIQPGIVTNPVAGLEIVFSEPIDSTSFDFNDIYLSHDGGNNLIDSTIIIEMLNDSVFEINLAGLTNNNGAYALGIDAAGVEDLQGNAGTSVFVRNWNQAISVPVITMFELPESPVLGAIDSVKVLFNIPVDSASFSNTDLYLQTETNDSLLLANATVQQLDNYGLHFGVFGLSQYNLPEGSYSLYFNLQLITSQSGQQGDTVQFIDWTLCQTSAPIIANLNDTAICINNALQLAVISNNSSAYNWTTNGDGAFSDNTTLNPIYTPGATDQNNLQVELSLEASGLSSCNESVTTSINLQLVNLPTANAGDDATICSNQEHQLFGIVSNTNNFHWGSNGDGTFDNINSPSATYTPGTIDAQNGEVALSLWAVGESGCAVTVSDTMILTVQTAANAFAGNDTLVCENQIIQLNASISNSNNFSWSTSGDGIWTNQSSLTPSYLPGLNDRANGTVNLELTALPNTQCLNASVDAVAISLQQLPRIDLDVESFVCSGQSIELQGSFENYNNISWSSNGDGVFDNTFITNPEYTAGSNDETNQSVQLSVLIESNDVCFESDSAFTMLHIIAPPIVNLGDDINTNTASYETLSPGIDFSSYAWSNGEISSSIEVYAGLYGAGTFDYFVTVTDEFGCTNSDTLALIVTDTITSQLIALPGSWSMFSTYIEPIESNIADMLAPLGTNLVIAKSGTGQTYWPEWGVNLIGNIATEQGYALKLLQSDTLEIIGYQLHPDTVNIGLPNSWSILAYLRTTPAPVSQMLSSIVSNIHIVKNYKGHIYWPQYGVNLIGNMHPGEAYQIKLIGSQSFVYPGNHVIYQKAAVQNASCKHFSIPNSTNNNMTLGIPLSAWDELPPINSEIGVLAQNGMLIGSGLFTGQNMAISIWGNDEHSMVTDGLLNKEEYTIVCWNAQSEEQQTLLISNWFEGDNAFATNKIAIVGNITMEQTDFVRVDQNTPNPFARETQFNFYLPEQCHITLTIYNVTGAMMDVLVSNNMQAGEHRIAYNAAYLPAGSYFYKVETKNEAITKKMLIVR